MKKCHCGPYNCEKRFTDADREVNKDSCSGPLTFKNGSCKLRFS